MLKRFPTIVALHYAHHLGRQPARFLETTHLEARLETQRDFGLRVDQLLLDELERREGALELFTLERVRERPLYAIFQRADGPPGNTVPNVHVIQVNFPASKNKTHRALFRQLNGALSPCPWGRIWSCGTLTASMKIDPVTDARRATLFLIDGASRPFMPYAAHFRPRRKDVEESLIGVTCLFEDEAAHFAIPFAARPYHKYVAMFIYFILFHFIF